MMEVFMASGAKRGRALVLGLTLGVAIASCQSQAPVQADLVADAKAVLAAHEDAVKAADLESIVANAAEDVVVLVPGAPLIEGRDAVRAFYQQLLAAGSGEFKHEYSGQEVIGDAVVLHGVARGVMPGPDGEALPFANNFILVMKKDGAGKMKFWRVAFAPSAT
jgi:ketosteroid isomerase-like protein